MLVLLQQVVQLVRLIFRTRWGIGVRRNNFHSHSLTTSSHPSPTFASSHSSASLAANSTVPLAGETRLNEIVDRCNMLDPVASTPIWMNPSICCSIVEAKSGSVKPCLRSASMEMSWFTLASACSTTTVTVIFTLFTSQIQSRFIAMPKLIFEINELLVSFFKSFVSCCCTLLPALIKNLQHFFSSWLLSLCCYINVLRS